MIGSARLAVGVHARETGAARAVCDVGASIGTSLGPSLVGVVWFIGFITIGLIWVVSRPKSVPR